MLGRKRTREETEVKIADHEEEDEAEDEEHDHDHDHEEVIHSDEEDEEQHNPRHLFQQLFTWSSHVPMVSTQHGGIEPGMPDFIFTFENCTLVENFHPFQAGHHIPIIQVNLWHAQITLAVTGSEMYTYDLVMGAIPNEPLDTLGEEEEEEESNALKHDDDEEEKH